MASKEVNNNIEKLTEDLQTIDITDDVEVQIQEDCSLSIISPSHDVMYDPELLKSVPSVAEVTTRYSNFICRPLQSDDYNRGFISLLQQLTSVGSVGESDFKNRFQLLKKCQGTYYHTVIVDTEKSDQIIASASLVIEKKFIHDCANRGVIEEVIVNNEYRGKSLGKQIVNILVELGKQLGCYKITLNCNNQMLPFYIEKLGFVAEQNNANFLVIRVSTQNQTNECPKPKQAWGAVPKNKKAEVLFDPILLETFKSIKAVKEKDQNLYVRPLQSDDFKNGVIEILKQLTSVGNITESDYRNQFETMKSCNGTYYQTVIVDKSDETSERIIGSATLMIERKFIHDCANRGLIEDVIVSDQYRGKSLGTLILQSLIELGKSLGCYKITLNCKDKMIPYYERLGFVAEESNANFLVIRV